jgi:Zn-dependent peptidase ImmA (M78 family)
VVKAEHKMRVREIAAQFSREHPAREPHDLADAIGARLEYGDLGDKDGMFDPHRNVVLLSKQVSLERQRFTMAHEITHALILNDDDLLSDLHDVYEGDILEETIEVLCNVGASAILVPETELAQTLERYGRGARVIPRIAQTYGISRPAACVTLAEHLETRAIVAILRTRGRNPQKQLEVEFAAKTDQMKYPLKPGTLIPEGHAIYAALETGLPMEFRAYIPFRSGKKMPAAVDAHPEAGTVFTVFTVLNGKDS